MWSSIFVSVRAAQPRNGAYRGTYRRILDAGHPVLTVPAPVPVAEQLRADLDWAHEHRRRQAGQALGLATGA
ncbi:hypothetical protein ABZS61_03525 [Streptomyces sp. NPDC005566]|uniref:hypothetical protein n=1 Tax=Streptomyces sp. NPDC005566 TaxID=3156886 RepID=UPI00339EC632